MKTHTNPIIVAVLFGLLTGCASIPDDLGKSDVDVLLNDRGVQTPKESQVESKEYIDSLSSDALTADTAVRIALANNPNLKTTYAELGIAAADVYEAGRVHNPIFHFSTLDSNESGESNSTTFGLITSFTSLITLPSRKRYAEGEFERVKELVAAEVLEIVTETENAYYDYVAAEQMASVQSQIAKAGYLSFELAKRYDKAGNLSPREFLEEQIIASETKLESLDASAEAFEKRTELVNLLGFSLGQELDVFTQLPVPVSEEDDLDTLIELARNSRLDYSAAHKNAELLADKLGVTNWTRWLGELEIGIEHENETDGAQLTGPTVEWELPIFSQNLDANLRANAELQIAIAEVKRLDVEVENDVRLAHAAVLNARERINEYEKGLLPARIDDVARAQEEENFMLIGTFELLEVKREEYEAYLGYLSAVKDYWHGRVELSRAVGNTLPSASLVGDSHINIEDYLAPKSSGMDHSSHQMDHSEHNMDHSDHQTDHSKHEMDHSDHEMKHTDKEMDHSEHNMDRSDHQMDHSDHEMEHSDKEVDHFDHDMNHSNQEMDHSDHQMNNESKSTSTNSEHDAHQHH